MGAGPSRESRPSGVRRDRARALRGQHPLPGLAAVRGAHHRPALADDVADPPVGIETWSARAVPAGTVGPDGATRLGDGSGAPTFGPPPPGDWSVEVALTFADGLGEARYFWALTVVE